MSEKFRVYPRVGGGWVAQYDNDGGSSAPFDAWSRERVSGAWAEHKEGTTLNEATDALIERLQFLGMSPPSIEYKIASLP